MLASSALLFAEQSAFIAGGGSHTLAIKNDSTVWAWGDDAYGQIGGTGDQATPAQVSGVDSVKAVAAGKYHSVALKTDGTVWTWGSNDYYELGRGVGGTQDSTPGQVKKDASNLFTDVIKAITCGTQHTVAIKKSDGTVWAWGRNQYGQLGHNSSDTISQYPVQVVKSDGTGGTMALTNIKAIAAGYGHTIALDESGNVWAWGYNNYGQLGDDSNTNSLMAIQVKDTSGAGVLSGVTAIAATGWHNLAIIGGAVYAWGKNLNGQLGDGTTNPSDLPIQSDLTSGAIAVACGTDFSLALKSDGTVWGWGDNQYYQVGNNPSTTDDVKTPDETAFDSTVTVTSIAAGFDHGIALSRNQLWTWGLDDQVQLGDDANPVNQPAPVQVSGLFGFIGDINGDGLYDLADVIVGLQICVGYTTTATPNLLADIDGDGQIGLAEVLGRLENEAQIR